MAKLNVELVGMERLVSKLKSFGEKAEQETKSITKLVASDIATEAKLTLRANAYDLGNLARSVTFEPKTPSLSTRIFAGGGVVNYAAYVEFGTGAKAVVPPELSALASKFKGKGGKFKDGLEAIKDWCKRHGIDESAAYPIFMSILKKGLEPRPYMYPAYVKGRSEYIKMLKEMIKRYGKDIS